MGMRILKMMRIMKMNLIVRDILHSSLPSPPKRHEQCRICQQLEKDGDTKDLYDNHVHSYPSGCPRYVQMTVKEGYLMCYKARICACCHDPDYVWKPNDSNHNCPSYGKKGRFSCKEKECKLHMWVCDKHQRANKEALENFRDKYKADYNLDFGLVV